MFMVLKNPNRNWNRNFRNRKSPTGTKTLKNIKGPTPAAVGPSSLPRETVPLARTAVSGPRVQQYRARFRPERPILAKARVRFIALPLARFDDVYFYCG